MSPRHIPAAIVIAASILAAPAFGQGGPPPAAVTLDAARLETLERWVDLTGELLAPRRAVIASRQAGLVVEMLVDDGQTLEAGAVIARLDDTLARLEVAEREATVAARRAALGVRRAELDKASRDWARYQQLAGRSAVAETEIDDVRARVETAQAQLALAEADIAGAESALHTARERLEQRVVRAPFAGRVLRKRIDLGAWVGEGGEVVELIDLSRLEVSVNIPEAMLGRVREGSTKVIVRLPAMDREYQGKVARVMPEADRLSRLVPVRVVIDEPDQVLRPGLSVRALVADGTFVPTLTVHKDAIMRDDAGQFLYWSANGTGVPARVRTLFGTGDRVAIEAQIPPGAMVVTRGNERLFPGQPLMPAGGPPPGAPGTRPDAKPDAKPDAPDAPPRRE